MNIIEPIKMASGLIVSIGIGTVIGNAIKATTPEGIGTINKVLVGIGTLAVSGYLSMKASDKTESVIQETSDSAMKLFTANTIAETIVPPVPAED